MKAYEIKDWNNGVSIRQTSWSPGTYAFYKVGWYLVSKEQEAVVHLNRKQLHALTVADDWELVEELEQWYIHTYWDEMDHLTGLPSRTKLDDLTSFSWDEFSDGDDYIHISTIRCDKNGKPL